jgi:hypothetical protein
MLRKSAMFLPPFFTLPSYVTKYYKRFVRLPPASFHGKEYPIVYFHIMNILYIGKSDRLN